MLEGNGSNSGLAALMQGAKGTGQYGSSTSALLGNDLVSRIVGEIAKLTSSKVTTNSGQTNTSTTSTAASKGAQAAALAALAKALMGSKGGSKEGGKSGGAGGGGRSNSASNKMTASQERRAEDMQAEMDNSNKVFNWDKEDSESLADEMAQDSQGDVGVNTQIDIGDITPVMDTANIDYTGDEETMVDLTDIGGGGDFSGDSDVVDNFNPDDFTGGDGEEVDGGDPIYSDEGE